MTDQTVALTIIQQLGGIGKLQSMIAAHEISYTENLLRFKFKGCRKFDTIIIRLNGLDLYDIEFIRFNKTTFELTNKKEFTNIYADMMKGLIEKETGLYLSL